MSYSIEEIAQALGLAVEGDGSLRVSGVAEPADAGPETLALAMKPDFAEGLKDGQAQAAVMWHGADWQAYGLRAALLPVRPRMTMAGLTRMLDKGPGYPSGVHPSAVIDPTARLGADVSVGPFTVIAAGVEIGAGSIIGPQCYIGTDTRLGAGALLHAGVKIGARVVIGDRFIAQLGAIIGSDGFSFVTPEVGAVEKVRASLGKETETAAQSWVRIHSLGSVVIGDDVDIGSVTTIDAGTIRPTQIGNGTKIDNHGHIAHNVVIGRDCLFAGMTGVAGSTVIGNNVVLGGRVGVSDNLTVGNNVVAGGGSGIMRNVADGTVVLGYPAVKMDQNIEMYKSLRRLPRMMKQVAELQKAVFKGAKTD